MIFIVEIHNRIQPPACWTAQDQDDFISQLHIRYLSSVAVTDYQTGCDWLGEHIGPFMIFESHKEAKAGYMDDSLWIYYGCDTARLNLYQIFQAHQ